MRVLVCGSRKINDKDYVFNCIDNSKYDITEIVSGHAIGVDRLGEMYAVEHNIPIRIFSPNWKENGNVAGIIRNKKMVEYSDAVISIWDGKSNGTRFTIDYSKKMKKPIKIWIYNK